MSDMQKLNNVEHADVRVRLGHGADMGDSVMFSVVFPDEMRAMQSCYPLMFYRDPASGDLHPIALLGFEQGENLYLDGDQWDAPYIPMMVQRGPFMIAAEGAAAGGSAGKDPLRVVAIDMAHPRVSRSEGQPLFLEHGGNSDYLERMADMLEAIHTGHRQNPALVEALSAAELIVPVDVKITLNDGSAHQLSGFHSIDDERLQTLDAPALEALNRAGHLLPAYMMVASQSQLKGLITRKNARLDRG